MGNQMQKPEPNNKGPGTYPTTASAVTSTPCLSGHPKEGGLGRRDQKQQKSKEHLVLAFFAGVILTLLLMAFVFLIIKSYRKSGHCSPQTLDPPSDHPAKLSSSEEVLNYASMNFKAPKENSDHLTKDHSVHSEPVVYAQVTVTNSPCLFSEA